ncbi:MAG: FAD-dependent oxidoreductase [Cyclobacteriaceae bacterium]
MKARLAKFLFLAIAAVLWIRCTTTEPEEAIEVDICVYGGTSAGVIAAYTAQQLGKRVILIEPGIRLGGLSSGGLGYTDIGNKYAITGLARDFYRRIGMHYGKFEQWIFEPSVAEQTFRQYIEEGEVPVLYQYRLREVVKQGKEVTELIAESSADPTQTQRVKARMFIDCSYEGDLMAGAAFYTVGRESNERYNETINGVQLLDGHQFPDNVDPYQTPGDSTSGLLWGVADGQLAPNGSGDSKVQAYNYRICLTDDPANRVPITKPEGYDSTRYELLLRLFEAQPGKRTLNDYFIWSKMPNRKTDINNRGGFSTDMIGMNYDYPKGDYATRARIIRAHEAYTKGLLYFYGHDARVPDALRAEMQQWGYPKDEYVEFDNWSPQLYIREARRMVGEYVMTQANCEGKEVVNDGVGLAAYTMDSHNCQRLVVNGMVKNEGNVEVGGFGPYPISYRALIPKETECSNLLVPVCLSATHIAFGSIRMEPVFMVLAQSSAMAASMAIDDGVPVQQVDVARLQKALAENPLVTGAQPEILVDDNDHYTTWQGGWDVETTGGYGPTFHRSGDKNASARFAPVIETENYYDLYLYFPKVAEMAPVTTVKVFDGTRTTEVPIKGEDIIVEGQTSGEWASLGRYNLAAGKSFYVDVRGTGSGVVVADALILVPERP